MKVRMKVRMRLGEEETVFAFFDSCILFFEEGVDGEDWFVLGLTSTHD